MPRMARVVVPGFPHHVTQRGNRRQRTFFNNADYVLYRRLMTEHTRKAGTEVWAYCLMPNHVHLVMVPQVEDGLRRPLAEVHRRYTRYVNFRAGWRGHLWQERFHSFVMDEAYLLAAVRYIEHNPVAAGLCAKAEQWRWSSARAHLEGQDDALVTVAPMLERVADWRQYLGSAELGTDMSDVLSKHARTGRPLGSKGFVAKLERLTGRLLAPRRPGPAPKNRVK